LADIADEYLGTNDREIEVDELVARFNQQWAGAIAERFPRTSRTRRSGGRRSGGRSSPVAQYRSLPVSRGGSR
jgi:hypothetical protein